MRLHPSLQGLGTSTQSAHHDDAVAVLVGVALQGGRRQVQRPVPRQPPDRRLPARPGMLRDLRNARGSELQAVSISQAMKLLSDACLSDLDTDELSAYLLGDGMLVTQPHA
jgi:hypothetical protein